MTMYGLTGPQVKTLVKIKEKVLGTSSTTSSVPPSAATQHQRGVMHLQLTSSTDPLTGLWDAVQVVIGSAGAVTAVDGGGTIKVVVRGCVMKAGLVVVATNDFGTWVADGYPFRVLDWGTGAQSPFIYEGDIMKIKTWKTTNGITWTQEKINIDTEPC
jgi:hypothetical protein